jgi:hypothetical protein
MRTPGSFLREETGMGMLDNLFDRGGIASVRAAAEIPGGTAAQTGTVT